MGKQFLISNFKTGLKNDIDPFLLMEDSFPLLEDAFVWRDRVRRRFGFNLFDGGQLNSRLRVNIGTTAAVTGNFSVTVPGTVFAVGQMFSIGTTLFTVDATGAPATLLTTGTATGTYNTTTGALVITGNTENPTTDVYFYPATPVMGLVTRELATLNNEQTVAFDTQFSYIRVGTGWGRLDAATTWTGSNSNFFWPTNYQGQNAYDKALFVTNFNVADNIKFLPLGASAWTNLRPQLNTGASRYLETCKILLPFKGRLVALGTIEDEGGNDRDYPNRCRFSRVGDPRSATASWIDDTPGQGGYIDAPTGQQIVSASFVKDRLMVRFERSTWELVYTGNQVLPFIWQRINTELGAESTFSDISFDDYVLGVGLRGVNAASIGGVKRIDENIPQEVYRINDSNEGQIRTYGIRDHRRELAMWTFPTIDSDKASGLRLYPDKVLVYNYKNQSFALFNDSFTCYGYYYRTSGLTWATLPYKTWSAWNVPWNSGIGQAAAPLIVAGNQQGWTFLLEDTGTNDASLYITNLVGNTVSAVDHNLQVGQYVYISGVQGATFVDETYQIQSLTDKDTFVVDGTAATGTYTGGGLVERLNNFDIKTKDFSVFKETGQEIQFNSLNFYLKKTAVGSVNLDIMINTSNEKLPDYWGDGTILTRAEDNDDFAVGQRLIWHQVDRQTTGSSIQLELSLNDAQMRDRDIQSSDFELHGIILDVESLGRLDR